MGLRRRLSPLKQRALALWYGEGGMPCVVNGEMYSCDPRHRFAPVHDPAAAELLRRRVGRAAVVLNVGANVGVYAVQLARWAPQGRTYAFEPSPAAVRVLRRHLGMNDCEARVEVVEMAVGDAPGDATLFTDGEDVMGRLESPNPLIARTARPISVKVTTLDQFCAERSVRPDWVVMDIEGFEVAALRGGRRLLADRGVEFVVEMHPNVWGGSAGASRAELEALLRAHHRLPVPLAGQGDPLAEHGMVHLSWGP